MNFYFLLDISFLRSWIGVGGDYKDVRRLFLG